MNYFKYKIFFLCLLLSSCGNLQIKNKFPELKEKQVTFIRPVKIFYNHEPESRTNLVETKKTETPFKVKPKKKKISVNPKKINRENLKLKNHIAPKKTLVSIKSKKKEMEVVCN